MKSRQSFLLAGSFLLLLGASLPVLRFLNHSLVIDQPSPAELILVPSGDFYARSAQALRLARAGMAPQILIDEGAENRIFGRTLAARRHAQLRGAAVKISVCPIMGDSTFGEAGEASSCLGALGVHRVLIVTSDYHTRRALAAFQTAMPSVQFSVASTPTEFSRRRWWSASSLGTSLEEWAALVWWRLFE